MTLVVGDFTLLRPAASPWFRPGSRTSLSIRSMTSTNAPFCSERVLPSCNGSSINQYASPTVVVGSPPNKTKRLLMGSSSSLPSCQRLRSRLRSNVNRQDKKVIGRDGDNDCFVVERDGRQKSGRRTRNGYDGWFLPCWSRWSARKALASASHTSAACMVLAPFAHILLIRSAVTSPLFASVALARTRPKGLGVPQRGIRRTGCRERVRP